MTASRMTFLTAALAVLLAITAGYFFVDSRQSHADRVWAEQLLEDLAADNTRLDNRLRDLSDENANLRSSLDSFNQQQTGLSDVVEELRMELAAVTDDYRRLLVSHQDAQRRLESADERLARLAPMEETSGELRAELDRRNRALNELETRNAGLREELDRYRSEVRNVRTNLSTQRAQVSQLESRLNQEQQALDELQNQLETLSSEKQALIQQVDNGNTVIKLPERILFETGSAVLNDQAQAVLAEVARAIASFPDYTIAVIGHSDSRPLVSDLKNIYPTNWELSSARASAAVRQLIDLGIGPERLKATGVADTRPLVPETNSASRRENRRIEVVLEPPLEVRSL